MRCLIACEKSGRVREAFAKKGWESWSCDIQDTDLPGNHIKGDVTKILRQKWDLVIGFPPCTYLSSAGLYLCNIEQYGKKAFDRIRKREKAVNFFLSVYFANSNLVVVENPIGYISSSVIKPDQIIHPYYFGEPHKKRTALWLRGLPPLLHSKGDLFTENTHVKAEPIYVDASGKKRFWADGNSDKDKRSLTFLSVADAMAEQWTDFYLKTN